MAVVVALAVTVMGSLVACAPTPPPPVSASPSNSRVRPPIVMTHGWQFFCGSEGDGTWKTWIAEAHRRGYGQGEIGVFSYDTCRPNSEAIAGFGRYVDDMLARTGATKVDVIAHSMGSLIARACIRFGTCAGKVDKFLSLAGANHGTVWANFCELAFWSKSTCDMKPDGAFLADLNGGDETWGDTEYVTMISWCDLTIVPFTSAHLDGALNIVTDRCITHTGWQTDDIGRDWALDWFGNVAAAAPPASATLGAVQ